MDTGRASVGRKDTHELEGEVKGEANGVEATERTPMASSSLLLLLPLLLLLVVMVEFAPTTAATDDTTSSDEEITVKGGSGIDLSAVSAEVASREEGREVILETVAAILIALGA